MSRFLRITGIILPIFLFAILAFHVAVRGNFAFDVPLMMWVHQNIGSWFTPVAVGLHYVGKTKFAVPVIALMVAWLYHRRLRAYALWLSLATLLPTLNMLLMKWLIERPRPQLWEWLMPESNTSFPSGHSTFAAALAVMLILVSKHSPHRRILTAAALTFAFLMGFSRVYLGVHYPSDVLSGWINGGWWAFVLYDLLLRKQRLR